MVLFLNKDNSDVGKTWLDFKYILRVKLINLFDRLNVGYKRVVKDDVKFVIN